MAQVLEKWIRAVLLLLLWPLFFLSLIRRRGLPSWMAHVFNRRPGCQQLRNEVNAGQKQAGTHVEMEKKSSSTVELDEDLHSRQLAVYGRETMRRLLAANVLISGLNGLGVEIAKNIVLAGIRSLTLHDTQVVETWDLAANFFFSESDIGKNRALACVEKLQDLNSSVLVFTYTEKITEAFLSGFQAAVFVDITMKDAFKYDKYCHSHNPPIAFVKADICGLFGSVFCDFGPKFLVLDVDGEEPHTGIIASISNDNPALVSCVDDEKLEFQDGDLVVFCEIEGMIELNDGKPRRICNCKPYSFALEENTTNFGVYEKGGIVTQVKSPKVLTFRPLAEAISNPGDFLLSDFAKHDRPPLLHLAFQALDLFRQEYGRFPISASNEDASKFVCLVKLINDRTGEQRLNNLDEKVLRHFSDGARAVLNPMAAMFGGIVGQEVVKACSGKFHPIFQFLHFDSLESLPSRTLLPSDVQLLNTRYDAQICVFGNKMQHALEDARVFVVGSGALGCEFLKNLALMGVACGSNGRLVITDDDVVEKSNLTRQFLFRDRNIGESKSAVAAASASAINSCLRIEAFDNRVSPDTEDIFDDTFWENIDVVINALDNVDARLYVDSKCVYFQKPLLESGTLGTKCNTQVIIPFLTENYGASRDPPERQAPMCTLHSFPHNIDHCLTWARSEFEGLFEKGPSEVNAFLLKPEEYKTTLRSAGDAQARESLERLIEYLVTERCKTFEDCVVWARKRFEDYFANRIKQLIFTFPEDATTSTGIPFWSAPKRFPKPLEFTTQDPAFLSFITAASILRAQTYNIPVHDWVFNPNKLAGILDKIQLPKFEPNLGLKIETDEKDTTHSSRSDDITIIEQLISVLDDGALDLPSGFQLNPIQFEKDNDSNYHMDMIVSLANMRARSYGIPQVDKLKAKIVAGRIIPAIATTTAMATGLVCLELYKVLLAHKVDKYRNTFANLALPLFSMAEPVPPKRFKHGDLSWSIWDRWTIRKNLTIRELIEWFQAKGLTAYSISCGQSLLYSEMFPVHRERLDRKVLDLAMEIAKLENISYRQHFDVVVACEDDDGNDINVPLVSIYFH